MYRTQDMIVFTGNYWKPEVTFYKNTLLYPNLLEQQTCMFALSLLQALKSLWYCAHFFSNEYCAVFAIAFCKRRSVNHITSNSQINH